MITNSPPVSPVICNLIEDTGMSGIRDGYLRVLLLTDHGQRYRTVLEVVAWRYALGHRYRAPHRAAASKA